MENHGQLFHLVFQLHIRLNMKLLVKRRMEFDLNDRFHQFMQDDLRMEKMVSVVVFLYILLLLLLIALKPPKEVHETLKPILLLFQKVGLIMFQNQGKLIYDYLTRFSLMTVLLLKVGLLQ